MHISNHTFQAKQHRCKVWYHFSVADEQAEFQPSRPQQRLSINSFDKYLDRFFIFQVQLLQHYAIATYMQHSHQRHLCCHKIVPKDTNVGPNLQNFVRWTYKNVTKSDIQKVYEKTYYSLLADVGNIKQNRNLFTSNKDTKILRRSAQKFLKRFVNYACKNPHPSWSNLNLNTSGQKKTKKSWI